MSEKVTPYKSSNERKKEQVTKMFDTISKEYDSLNRVISFGIDIKWRNKVVEIVGKNNPETILDIATGTGDLAISLTKTSATKIIGLDISEGMLSVGRKKIEKLNLNNKIEMVLADSEEIPFEDASFDAITVAFGVRNFENLEKGLAEINRVLRPGGVAMILEFSKPKGLFGVIFSIYNKTLLPLWGKLFSGDNAAYKYLPESVAAFPEGDEFKQIMTSVKYKNVTDRRLTFGICSIYTGLK